MSSLITEEQRKELEGKSKEELAALIKAHKIRLRDMTVRSFAGSLKIALRKSVFDVITDPSKRHEEMAEELHCGKKTINRLITSLVSIGVVKRPDREAQARFSEEVWATVTKLGPSTYKELAIALNTDTDVINDHVLRLMKSGRVNAYKVSAGGPGSRRYKFYKLFDGDKLHTGDAFVILPHNDEHLEMLSRKVLSTINIDGLDEITGGMRSAITRCLRNAHFPEEVVEMVKKG